MSDNSESVFKKLDPVVADLENIAIACDEESEYWIGKAAQKGIERIETLQNQIKELEVQIKWIPVSDSLPSDRREVDVVYRTQKKILDRAFDRYDINNGFSLDVTHWKYQTELPDARA